VGIGTASPTVALDVVGGIDLTGSLSGATVTATSNMIAGGTGSVGYTGLNQIVAKSTGNSGIVIDSGSTSLGRIAFGDGALASYIEYSHSDNTMRLWVTGTGEVMRLTSSGNVGIGTTSPSTTLHVAGDTTFGGAIDETVYALSGTSVALNPSNGTIQTHTLSGNTTYSDSLSAGESITLMIDDGSAYTITWPTMTWVNNGGSAPTLATSGYTTVALWKVSTTLYGALVGNGS